MVARNASEKKSFIIFTIINIGTIIIINILLLFFLGYVYPSTNPWIREQIAL